MYLPRLACLLWLLPSWCLALGLQHAGEPGLVRTVRPHKKGGQRQDLGDEIRRAVASYSAPIPEGLIMREAMVWLNALKEANLNKHNISSFGRSVGKIPGSWVEKVNAMDHTKYRTYNFEGSFFAGDVKKYRHWVKRFAKDHFGAKDILRWTDAPKSYEPLGSFDKTNTPGGFRPKDFVGRPRWTDMDPEYFEILLGSNFTLCPRGDRAFSYRFYEAALTHSIPVVSSLDVDLATTVPVTTGKSLPQRLRCIGYHYYSLKALKDDVSRLEYRRDWAEENYKLFIRYQTFLEGDNVPPGCPPTVF